MAVNMGKESDRFFSERDQEGKFKLRKEQLDILKKWVKTGEVTVRKEIITEEKTIVVPVTREILVIENNATDIENPDFISGQTETIRIPISEERIEVIKHPTVLEDIEIYKRKFQKIEHIEKTLKSEKVHVEIVGKAKVSDKEGQ
jgi:uncharacterized protein (TIGR02271 family)